MLNNPNIVIRTNPFTARTVEGKRLAYYRSKPDADFWDTHWRTYLDPKTYGKAECGHLWQFEEVFTAHLPKKGRILEAGCGLGQYVLALRVRGYDVEGVEWAPETVEAVRTRYPDLPIRIGDVTELEVPDGYYSGYISLGVVEHLQKGPEPFLCEAYRVLEPGGVALISVPYCNVLRRFKARLGLYGPRVQGMEFYQYAFTRAEFTSILRSAGFKVFDNILYDIPKGVRDEIPVLRWVFRLRGIGWRLQHLLQSWAWAKRDLGHMILFVCGKSQKIEV